MNSDILSAMQEKDMTGRAFCTPWGIENEIFTRQGRHLNDGMVDACPLEGGESEILS